MSVGTMTKLSECNWNHFEITFYTLLQTVQTALLDYFKVWWPNAGWLEVMNGSQVTSIKFRWTFWAVLLMGHQICSIWSYSWCRTLQCSSRVKTPSTEIVHPMWTNCHHASRINNIWRYIESASVIAKGSFDASAPKNK